MQINVNEPHHESDWATAQLDLVKVLPNITENHPEWTSCVVTITRAEWEHYKVMQR